MISFVLRKRAWWRRHEIVLIVGEQSEVVFRSWKWDRADDVLELLDRVANLAVEEER